MILGWAPILAMRAGHVLRVELYRNGARRAAGGERRENPGDDRGFRFIDLASAVDGG